MIISPKTQIFLSLTFSLIYFTTLTHSSLIEQTCKKTPNYNLCFSVLKSDPRSSKSDTTGLALIIVDKIKKMTIQTVNSIDNSLIKQHPNLRKQLSSCSQDYKIALKVELPEAVEALTKGNPKFAEDGVVGTGNIAEDCEKSFSGRSPMSGMNRGVTDLAGVGRAIIRMLL